MQPSEWNRKTIICGLSEIPQDFLDKLREIIEQRELSDPLSGEISCAITQNVKTVKQGFFGRLFAKIPAKMTTIALVTDAYFFWGTRTEDAGVTLSSAPWERLEITDYKATLIDDHGLQVSGSASDMAGQNMQWFIGLGRGRDGQRIKSAIKAASKKT